jgi:hypothetical protein
MEGPLIRRLIMKTAVAAFALATLAAGSALAASPKFGGAWGNDGRNVTPRERAAIAASEARLNQIRRQAWSDGRLSIAERIRIRNAELQVAALKRRARL